jgi:hypothetical protein
MTHKYYVHDQGDLVGEYASFDAALKAYQAVGCIYGSVSADGCEYATDTGWFDGLTEEERDQL